LKPPFGGVTALIVASLGQLVIAGSPPLSTDDPETPGYGGWEINVTSSYEHTRDGTVLEAPLFDINYGLTSDRDQLKLEIPLISNDPENAEAELGMGDFDVGYKYRFLDSDENNGWAISIYPQLSTPTGDERRGLGSGDAELLIPFEFQKSFWNDKLWINPEVGYNIDFGRHNSNGWKLGLAMGYEFPNDFEIQGEVGAFLFEDRRETDNPFFNIGFAQPLNHNVVLLGSAGRSFRSSEDGTPNFFCLFGVQFLFGAAAHETHPAHEEGAGIATDVESAETLNAESSESHHQL